MDDTALITILTMHIFTPHPNPCLARPDFLPLWRTPNEISVALISLYFISKSREVMCCSPMIAILPSRYSMRHIQRSVWDFNFFIVLLLTIARINSIVTSTPVLMAASSDSTGTCRNTTRLSSFFFVRWAKLEKYMKSQRYRPASSDTLTSVFCCHLVIWTHEYMRECIQA